MQRPKIAITMGDVAGIGPEVVARACADARLREWCRPVVVGDPVVLERAVQLCGKQLRIRTIPDIGDAGDASGAIDCWNPSAIDVRQVPPGVNNPRAGGAAYDWLVAAAQGALGGQFDAVTTAPISKAALHLAGRRYPGHTEILAEICGAKTFAMMLYLPQGPTVRSLHGLGVAHVTLHTSIASVPILLSEAAIRGTIGLIAGFLPRVGCARPRIGVCALNPHAGEEGLFGDEEARLIAPAVNAAARDGINAIGPLPADALMRRAVAGEFDGVAAMYHDQGHIALKLVAFDSAVNVTLGLPIVRTSPSHGTAFDIAWQGRARADGLLEAVRIASLLAASR
jgi:4-hydroxythreonine-4-phosphate dehydrogenase